MYLQIIKGLKTMLNTNNRFIIKLINTFLITVVCFDTFISGASPDPVNYIRSFVFLHPHSIWN